MTPEELRKAAFETHKVSANTKKNIILQDIKNYAKEGRLSYSCSLKPDHNNHAGITNITEVRRIVQEIKGMGFDITWNEKDTLEIKW